MESCCGCFRAQSSAKKKKYRTTQRIPQPRTLKPVQDVNDEDDGNFQNRKTQADENRNIHNIPLETHNTPRLTTLSKQQHQSQSQKSMQGRNLKSLQTPIQHSVTNRKQIKQDLITQKFESNLDLFFGTNASLRSPKSRHKVTVSLPATSNSSKTIYGQKSYRFLCHSCNKIFNIDLSNFQIKEKSLFGIQELFSQPQNIICDCPYCFDRAYLILNTQLIIGSQEQLEIVELLQDQQHQVDSEMDEKIGKIKVNELSFNSMKRGIKLNIDPQDNESSSRSHTYRIQAPKLVPKIFKSKVHRLKDGENMAQLFVLSDQRQVKPSTNRGYNTTTKATYMEGDEMMSSLAKEIMQSEVQSRYVPFDFTHKADAQQCFQSNKDLMRHLIEKKMKKNKTFLELKIFPFNRNNQDRNDLRLNLQQKAQGANIK